MCAEIHRLAFKIGKRTPCEIQTNKTSKTKKGRICKTTAEYQLHRFKYLKFQDDNFSQTRCFNE